MAKNDNLKDFLTDVADAIRAKKGTSGLINPQNFSSEIASIETGGGTAPVSSGNVTFYDYDGTILHSYSKDEFLVLTAMPSLPTQPRLTCQGWNYELETAKAYVEEYGVLDIGATYITDDGKTRLYIKIATEGRMDVPLYISQTVANGVTIDWGDGSPTETLSSTGNVNTTHHYDEIGDYVITLEVADGCTLGLGHRSSKYSVMGAMYVYSNMLQKVEVGERMTIGHYAFYNCYSLSSVVIPSSVTSIDDSMFYYCTSLSSVVIPSSVTNIRSRAFYYCTSLSSVVIPSSVGGIETYAFYSCYSLSSVVIPSSVMYIWDYVFRYCYSLSSVVIPSGVKSMGTYSFNGCYSLSSVVIPSSVTSIDNYAFQNCKGIAYYDFTRLTSIPTLGTTVFTGLASDCKIIVPDALYDEWIAASNWSTYASQIVKASEYNG